MKKIKVKFENCFGIKKLDHEFVFSRENAVLVYSPNGNMKSSFANIFANLNEPENICDRIFPTRTTSHSLLFDVGEPLKADDVLVIEAKPTGFQSEKISDLLVDKALKIQYDKIYSTIEKSKAKMFNKLRKSFPPKLNIEEEFCSAFDCDRSEFLPTLVNVAKTIKNKSFPHSNIYYNHVVNDKVETYLKKSREKGNLDEYISLFVKLINQTKYLKSSFNHDAAVAVNKSLRSNGYFGARHYIVLQSEDGKEPAEIKDDLQFDEILSAETTSILNNPTLKIRFEAVNKELSNSQLAQLRHVLTENRFFIKELTSFENARRILWYSYLQDAQFELDELLNAYATNQADLQEIVKKASSQKSLWAEVVDIFNSRFEVPFVVSVRNQGDVVLNETSPSVVFHFRDLSGQQELPREKLLEYLSAGEQRAFYLLNIIFEIMARKSTGKRTLIIADDIADSFDYKNKYAIIEFLKDVLEPQERDEDNIFRAIILTHNFDFYRTVQSRLSLFGDQCLKTYKTGVGELGLIRSNFKSDPFSEIRETLSSKTGDLESALIAAIPFVRNLIQYREGVKSANYLLLTALLHVKPVSASLKVECLVDIFKEYLGVDITPVKNTTVQSLILEKADSILTDNHSVLDKLILSIAARLRAESYMIQKIGDPGLTGNIESAQTGKLAGYFKKKFGKNGEDVKVINRVILCTPENIHFNSFMYEPIVDLHGGHLISLLSQVKSSLRIESL